MVVGGALLFIPMKTSELKAAGARVDIDESTQKGLRMSKRADPAITQAEAAAATVAVCCWHSGLIKTFGDKDGRMFLCPTGNQYWRYQKPRLRKTLLSPRKSIV